MNFTPQQQHSLLSKMGYSGPVDSRMMEQFIQSNPGAAAKMGKFDRAMKRGFQAGGSVPSDPFSALRGAISPTPQPSPQTKDASDPFSSLRDAITPTTPQPPGYTPLPNPFPDLPFNLPFNPQPPGYTPLPNPFPDPPFPDPLPKDASTPGVIQKPTGMTGVTSQAKDTYSEAIDKLVKAEKEASGWSSEVQTLADGTSKVKLVNSVTGEEKSTKWKPTEESAKVEAEELLNELQTKPVEEAQKEFKEAQQELAVASEKEMLATPSAAEITQQAISDPTALVTQVKPAKIQETDDQIMGEGTGVVAGEAPKAAVSTAAPAAQAAEPGTQIASTYDAAQASGDIKTTLEGVSPAQGDVTKVITAAQGELSTEAFAEGAKFDKDFIQLVEASKLDVTPEQLATAEGQDAIAPAAKIAESSGIDPAIAQQATVSENELPQAAQIKESEMAQAEAAVSDGKLSDDATAVAAKLDSFTVDNGTLAKAIQGNVNAQDTVQGQLSQLMRQFDDGTPVWAAGAMRAANAVMASRGLGGSSMAGTAIVQAAMESAIPIAAQDAQVFQQMNLANLDRRQQVSLANAAAQQGLSLQNLNNEQQAALQNSANAFQLQAQSLTNMQQTVIANAQIKASLQGQNLSNQQQTNLAVAARYAEVSNMNLNNRQQSALQNNSNNLQVDLSNLSNRQQSYIANAQLEASLQNQIIDNQQQVAIQNAARFSEAANITFTAEQQSKLHNSELMKTIGLAELNAEQAATLQNAAQVASMDMANLNNRQQAAVQNAQNFLQMDLTNLSNEQQTSIFKTQQRVNALLSDQAAENAAEQFNAASENQTNQFFADLQSTISRFNADQTNAINQFNAGQENAAEQFNASLQEQRDQFNANNKLIVAQANAKWRQDIATLDTAAENEALMEAAKTANSLTTTAMDEIWQRERDLMNFSFQTAENSQDRYTELLIADKTFTTQQILQAQELSAADKEGKGAIFGSIAGELVGGIVDSIF